MSNNNSSSSSSIGAGLSRSNEWCTIESDPGVFTELVNNIGVNGVQFDELYDVSIEEFQRLKPVYGLIFLFKWDKDIENDNRACEVNYDPDLFFANQTVNNACATQAILSILLNSLNTVDVGERLKEFRSFTMDFPPKLKGEAIGDHDHIRMVHNSFSRPEPFISDGKVKIKDDDDEVYHFIAYLPFKNAIYEIDGLKQGPIKLGTLNEGEDWLPAIIPHIQERMSRYIGGEIRFSLMAMIKDQRITLQEKLEELQSKFDSQIGDDEKNALKEQQGDLQAQLEEANQKYQDWKEENIRRRHNYIPFALKLLEILSSKGKLKDMVSVATQKAAASAATASKST